MAPPAERAPPGGGGRRLSGAGGEQRQTGLTKVDTRAGDQPPTFGAGEAAGAAAGGTMRAATGPLSSVCHRPSFPRVRVATQRAQRSAAGASNKMQRPEAAATPKRRSVGCSGTLDRRSWISPAPGPEAAQKGQDTKGDWGDEKQPNRTAQREIRSAPDARLAHLVPGAAFPGQLEGRLGEADREGDAKPEKERPRRSTHAWVLSNALSAKLQARFIVWRRSRHLFNNCDCQLQRHVRPGCNSPAGHYRQATSSSSCAANTASQIGRRSAWQSSTV